MESYEEMYITRHIPRAVYATDQIIISPRADINLNSIRLRYRAASVSGFVWLAKPQADQALSAANAVSGLISLCGTGADERIYGPPDTVLPRLSDPLYSVLNQNELDSIITGALGYRITKDQCLGLRFQGNLTGLEDLDVTVGFQKIVSGLEPDPYNKFSITRHIPTAGYATKQIVFTALGTFDLESVIARYRIGSGSGTMQVVKVPNNLVAASTAKYDLLTGTISLSGVADERITGVITSQVTDGSGLSGYRIKKNQSVGLVFAGDLAGLKDLDVTMIFKKVTTTDPEIGFA